LFVDDEGKKNTKAQKNISLFFSNKKSSQSVSGVLPASSLTALMGPSGSSKTTLLDVLSGRTTAGTLDRQGCVTYGGVREGEEEEFFSSSSLFPLSKQKKTHSFLSSSS